MERFIVHSSPRLVFGNSSANKNKIAAQSDKPSSHEITCHYRAFYNPRLAHNEIHCNNIANLFPQKTPIRQKIILNGIYTSDSMPIPTPKNGNLPLSAPQVPIKHHLFIQADNQIS